MTLSPLLLLHVCAGTVGLLTGTVAICVRKGSRTHGLAGIVFSVSMLTLAASGAYLGYVKSQTGNVLGGLVTLYMVATAWRAGSVRSRPTGVLDWVAVLVALAGGTSCLIYGAQVAQGLANAHGVPAGMDFFFGAVLLIAAAGDINVLLRRGLSGTPRIARHLWRMCFGLFIASGSFFMGRERIFPEFIRNSGILIFLTVLPLILLIFWLIRVHWTKAYGRMAIARESVGISTPT